MMSARSFDGSPTARAARARELKPDASPAADVLEFYAALVEYQQRFVDERVVGRVLSDPPSAGADRPRPTSTDSLLGAIDAAWVGRMARDLVSWLVRLKLDTTYGGGVAPPGLQASAEAICDVSVEEWGELFESYRASPQDAAARCSEIALFALEAVLQPIAERLAAHVACAANPSGSRGEPEKARPTSSRCPICGSAPVVGVLREEGHGARRRLVCGLCLTEWDYVRVACVKCGERRFDALPVFSAEQFPHARVDACDTCRSYLKTIDATKDGRAIPVVDDLATVALDLWAREQGYTRVRANLVRI